MDFVIRIADESDYGALCTLSEQGDRVHRKNLPHLFRKPEGPAREWEYIRSLLEDRNVALYVAETQSQLVGFVNVMLLRSADIPLMVPRRYAVIDNLVVDEDFRRCGVGRALMTSAEDWAREQGASSVELNVYAFNQPARRFYEVLGYGDVSVKMSKFL